MKLARVRVRNFRCFQRELSIDFEEITALIGKNDAGKSTILDALDIFLNDTDPDKDDASKSGDPKDLTIICEFTDLPEEVILDDSIPTKLEAEFLLNPEERLEIHKFYSGELQKPKCKSIEAHAYPLGELHLDEFPAADYFLNFVFQLAGSRSVIC